MPDDLLEMIKRNEGLSLKPYKDADGISIFYGHRLTDDDPLQVEVERAEAREAFGFPIDSTEEARLKTLAEMTLKKDVEKARQNAQELVPNFNNLSRRQQAALTDMSYNLGRTGLSKFVKMLTALKAGDFNTASKEVLAGTGEGGKSKYYNQVGERAERNAAMIKNATGFGEEAGGQKRGVLGWPNVNK